MIADPEREHCRIDHPKWQAARFAVGQAFRSRTAAITFSFVFSAGFERTIPTSRSRNHTQTLSLLCAATGSEEITIGHRERLRFDPRHPFGTYRS